MITLIGNATDHTVAVQFRWGARWVAECTADGCPWHVMHLPDQRTAYSQAEQHCDRYTGQHNRRNRTTTHRRKS